MKKETKQNIRVSLSVNADKYGGTRLQIDHIDRSRLLEIIIPQEELALLLGRMAHIELEAKFNNVYTIGKRRIVKQIEFQIGEEFSRCKENAIEEAKMHTPEGWECSNYFGSQQSFFHKDNKSFARTEIFKWVSEGEYCVFYKCKI